MSHNIRKAFPSLVRLYKGKPLIYFDGPAGTQVPDSVIAAISNYYRRSNANSHGQFITTRETDELLATVRQKAAAFLGAEGAHNISFGQNMTTLNYSLSRAIGRILQAGDEVLITQLDHEANRAPWLGLRAQGVVVREVRLLADGKLDYNDFRSKINERTRLVAMGYASNIFGTVNEVERVRKWTYEVGAWLLLDAVHYAPHLSIDVQVMGCDFLLCSAYKFYGPHVGILYSRTGLLDSLPTDCLRTQEQQAPYSIETGTLNHAALVGVGAAIDFIAGFGKGDSLRIKLVNALEFTHKQERHLIRLLFEGLNELSGIQIFGPPVDAPLRAPTLAFTLAGKTAAEVCAALGERGICAWDGHFYAIRTTEVLGLLERGGVTRMGLAIYNTKEEVEFVLGEVAKIAKTR